MRSDQPTKYIFSTGLMAIVWVLLFWLSIPAICQAQLSTGNPKQLLDKGLALMNKAKFEQSNKYLEKAATLFKKSDQPVMAAHCYNHLSSNNRLMSNISLARHQAQKALSLVESVKPKNPTEKIRAYTNLGLLAAIEANYDKSLKRLTSASKLLDAPSISPVLKMIVISSLGYLYDDLGKYDKALYYYNHALDILLAQPDPPKYRLAKLYNNLGVAYSNKGLYKQARQYYRLELKINLATKGENHPDVAGTYLNIGNSYFYSGDAGEAILYFKQAKRVIKNVYGHWHTMMALVLNSLGKSEMILGRYQKAIKHLKGAIAIKKRLLGPNHPELAANYTSLAATYAKKDVPQKAHNYYLKALNIQKKNLRNNHPDLAPTYTKLAKFLLDNNQTKKALVYLKEARNILLSSVGSRHPALAETYSAMGRAFAQQTKIVQSITHFQNALAITAPMFTGVKANDNPSPSTVFYPAKAISVLNNKAQALCLLYKKSKDRSLLQASLKTYYALSKLLDKLQWGYNQLNSKLAIARRSHKMYEQAINASYKMYKITGKTKFLEFVFYFSEKSKGRVLLEAVNHTNDKQLAGIPAEVLKREQELKFALSQVKQALYGRTNADAFKKMSSSRLKDSLFVLNRKLAVFTKKIEKTYPRYYQLKYNTSFPEIAVIQKKLNTTNTAIVEYFYGQHSNSLYAILITPQKIRVKSLETKGRLISRVQEFRKALITAHHNYTKLGYQLYKQLIQPIEPIIKSFTSLLIVPEGPLRLMPFGALLKNKVGVTKDYLFYTLPYLINDYNIRYATSISLNIAMSVRDGDDYKNEFIGFAPVFKFQIEKTLGDETDKHLVKWNPLVFSDYEIQSIASNFKNHRSFWSFLPWIDTKNVSIYIGNEATESNFKSDGLLSGRYIHLATHAFASQQTTGRTGIVFYQNKNSKTDDILYANEIYNLRLQTQLIVLSACQTGIGNIIPGEGLMGLTRAFQYAGANNLIVSLWKVGDRSTTRLMRFFYTELENGKPMSTALANAKKTMIRERKYAHPRYWATFKLIGSGRN